MHSNSKRNETEIQKWCIEKSARRFASKESALFGIVCTSLERPMNLSVAALATPESPHSAWFPGAIGLTVHTLPVFRLVRRAETNYSRSFIGTGIVEWRHGSRGDGLVCNQNQSWPFINSAISAAISSTLFIPVFRATLSASVGEKDTTSSRVMLCQIGRISCSPDTARVIIPSNS